MAIVQGCNCSDDGGRDGGPFDTGALEAAAIDRAGNLILLRTDGGFDLLVQNGDAGTTGSLSSPRWNPQATRLAFTDCDRAFVREPSGEVAPAHTRQGTRYRDRTCRVEWSSDGTRLAIDGTDDATDGTALFLVPLGGGNPQFVGEADHWAWEPGRQSLVYGAYDPDFSGPVTRRYDLVTGDAGVLFEGELLEVLRNGLLLFTRPQRGADGGSEQALLYWWPDGGVTEAVPPAWFGAFRNAVSATGSPFADEFMVRGMNDQSATRALRVSIGGAVSVLFDIRGGAPECFRFVPGGEWLSYEDGEPYELFAFSRDGGSAQLASPPLSGGAGCLDWRRR
jgi:hypothetical protein